MAHLPLHQVAVLESPQFFPQLISHPFMDALRVVFLFAAAVTLISAVFSVFRGGRFIYQDDDLPGASAPPDEAAAGTGR